MVVEDGVSLHFVEESTSIFYVENAEFADSGVEIPMNEYGLIHSLITDEILVMPVQPFRDEHFRILGIAVLSNGNDPELIGFAPAPPESSYTHITEF